MEKLGPFLANVHRGNLYFNFSQLFPGLHVWITEIFAMFPSPYIYLMELYFWCAQEDVYIWVLEKSQIEASSMPSMQKT